jgi:hypothetical protein
MRKAGLIPMTGIKVFETSFEKFKREIKEFVCSHKLLLWIARFLIFDWAYRYNCYQSIFLLVWLFHSLIYSKLTFFLKSTFYVYYPGMVIITLWFYFTNIPTFVDDSYFTVENYKFGLFKFEIPFLEFLQMFASLYFVCLVIFSQRAELFPDPKFPKFHLKTKKRKKRTISRYEMSIMLLFYHSDEAYAIFLFIYGLSHASVDHFVLSIFALSLFIYPEFFKSKLVYALIFLMAFCLEQFIWSLVSDSVDNENIINWFKLTGLYSDGVGGESKNLT